MSIKKGTELNFKPSALPSPVHSCFPLNEPLTIRYRLTVAAFSVVQGDGIPTDGLTVSRIVHAVKFT